MPFEQEVGYFFFVADLLLRFPKENWPHPIAFLAHKEKTL